MISDTQAVPAAGQLARWRRRPDRETSFPYTYVSFWLVISIHLKNRKVNWDDYSQYMEKYETVQTTNQVLYPISKILKTYKHIKKTGVGPTRIGVTISLTLTHICQMGLSNRYHVTEALLY